MLDCQLEDTDELCERVHRVFYEVFFQESSIVGGANKLFSSVIAAVLCVGGKKF